MQLDPVTLEILATKLAAAAEEMGFALQRSGRTLYVKETEDFGTGLTDLRGKIFAYPNGVGVTGFIDLDCRTTIEAVGALQPGDVIVTNHPFLSGGLATHLPDIHLMKPIFHDGRIVCYGWTFVHSADVGGRVPSSISPSNSEIYQEGLMIPPVKLVRQGELNLDVLAFIRANCRTAEENVGDIKAMLAALSVGERRVARIIGQHGVDVFTAATADVIAYSAAKARAAYRSIPDGTYEFWDYLDDELVSPVPVRIRAALTVRDGLLHLDFTGTDPQIAAAFNMPTAGTRHTWLSLRIAKYALTRDRTVPLNSGIFDPLTVTIPSGSLLNPGFPAAVGVRHATGNRIIELVNGLLAKAVPDYMPAGSGGIIIPVVFAEPEDETGRRNVIVVEPMTGGTGARLGADGADGRETSTGNMANNPLETVETSAAITVLHYTLRPDSGGPGCWRGGVGLELTFAPRRSGTQVLGRGMDRIRFQPWGLAGGLAGAAAQTILNRGRQDERQLGRIDVVELSADDTITILTPGGGGYGDPFEREPERVLRDVQRGMVSCEAAREDYGVVLQGGTIDLAATLALRAELRQARPPVAKTDGLAFDFGTNRVAWESVFDDALMNRIVAAILALSPGARRTARRRLFQPIADLLQPAGPIDAAALRRVVPLVQRMLAELEQNGETSASQAA
jgi:N-methylhydantoinase B